jgi:hypothetical protein
MLRRSYVSAVITVLGIGSLATQIEEGLLEERKKPHNWEKLSHEDKQNIRRYLNRRQRQGANREELRHDLSNLVGVATIELDGSLSTADMEQFGKVARRPTRVIPQFLVFTGSEAPTCPQCHNREYEPAGAHPNKMKCQECSFLYTNRELASMVSPGL